MPRYGQVWSGPERFGMAAQGLGVSSNGLAWCGGARLGGDGCGRARLGKGMR